MAWISLPNVIVMNFTGKPLRSPKLDSDLEIVYRKKRCHGPDCAFESTSRVTLQEHIMDTHDAKTQETEFTLLPQMVDMTVAHVILALLMRFNNQGRDNPLSAIHKTNDGMHAAECWRRAYTAMMDERPEIKLKQLQYEFLRTLLDRRVPLTKEAKDRAEESQDVAMYLYGLADDNVRQAFTVLAERRHPDHADVPLEVG